MDNHLNTSQVAVDEQPANQPLNGYTHSFVELPVSIFKQADGQSDAEVVYWALDRLKREQLFIVKESASVSSDEFKVAYDTIDRVQGIQDSLVELLFERLAEQV